MDRAVPGDRLAKHKGRRKKKKFERSTRPTTVNMEVRNVQLRIHSARREDNTVRADQNDGSALRGLALGRKAPNDFRAAHFHVRRRVGAEEDRNRVSFIEVFAV